MSFEKSQTASLWERWQDLYNQERNNLHKVKLNRSPRKDLHAFLLLDSLFPSDEPIVAYVEEDRMILNVSVEDVQSLSDENMLELLRCGVFYAPHYGLYLQR